MPDERFHHEQQLDRIERIIREGLALVNKKLGNMMLTENQIEKDQTAMNAKLDSLADGSPEQQKQIQDADAKVVENTAKLKAAIGPGPLK